MYLKMIDTKKNFQEIIRAGKDKRAVEINAIKSQDPREKEPQK